MRNYIIMCLSCVAVLSLYACKKDAAGQQACNSNAVTTRTIVNKKATVKLTATATHSIYLVEEGAIDTKLIPCSIAMEYYQHDLQVIISGEVKQTDHDNRNPCCLENFVITSISK